EAEGTWAEGGGHALDAARPRVAHREDTRDARFQEIRRPPHRPGGEVFAPQVLAGLDESLLVQRDAPAEPAGVRLRAGHEEQMTNGHHLAPAGCLDPHALERIAAQEPAHLGARVQRDERALLDSLDEVAGHALPAAISAHD